MTICSLNLKSAFRQLIKIRYGIDTKPSTLRYYLTRWGFSVQSSLKRTCKQDKKDRQVVQRRFSEHYCTCRKENAEIFLRRNQHTKPYELFKRLCTKRQNPLL